jgi:SAM-dependent methyltransferase
MANPRRGAKSRSRSLSAMNETLGAEGLVQGQIQERLAAGKDVRLLEVGCGEGRVLMELRKLFPSIELHGINKAPWPPMKGSESLRRTAINYKIFSRRAVLQVQLPCVRFMDAKELDFAADYFDLVISQVSVPFIERKDLFLEELWRVMRMEGVALLHLDHRPDPSPDFFLTETPRFVIYSEKKLLPLTDFVTRFPPLGFDLRCTTRTREPHGSWTVLEMRKTRGDALKLGLRLDALSSFSLELPAEHERAPDCYYGYRSVYSQEL